MFTTLVLPVASVFQSMCNLFSNQYTQRQQQKLFAYFSIQQLPLDIIVYTARHNCLDRKKCVRFMVISTFINWQKPVQS